MKFGVGFTIFKCIWELCVLELQNKKIFQARQLLVWLGFFIRKLVKTSDIDNYDLFFFFKLRNVSRAALSHKTFHFQKKREKEKNQSRFFCSHSWNWWRWIRRE